MARGDVKAGKSTLIGAAGEYFVMGELLRLGWLAGVTPRGARDFDIIATKGEHTIYVRVKTKTSDSRLFRWNRRDGQPVFRGRIVENDFCALVDVGDATTPQYYVAPTTLVEDELQRLHSEWVAGKAGRDPNNPVIAFVVGRDAWLDKYRGWSALPDATGT